MLPTQILVSPVRPPTSRESIMTGISPRELYTSRVSRGVVQIHAGRSYETAKEMQFVQMEIHARIEALIKSIDKRLASLSRRIEVDYKMLKQKNDFLKNQVKELASRVAALEEIITNSTIFV